AGVMVEHGFDVRPRARGAHPGNAAGIAGTGVFHDSVPRGSIVRIERRAVLDTRGEIPGDEGATVLVSSGARPRVLALLRDLQTRTGPLAGLDAIDEAAAAAIQAAGRLPVDFFRERAAAIAAIIGLAEEVLVAQCDREPSAGSASQVAEWLANLFGGLREHGVEVVPW